MTDGELLILAGKALLSVGDDVKTLEHYMGIGNRPIYVNGVEWNPLTDDGDAFRLLMKLNLLIVHYSDYEFEIRDKNGKFLVRFETTLPEYWRYAIVDAAAEIGKSMNGD